MKISKDALDKKWPEPYGQKREHSNRDQVGRWPHERLFGWARNMECNSNAAFS